MTVVVLVRLPWLRLLEKNRPKMLLVVDGNLID